MKKYILLVLIGIIGFTGNVYSASILSVFQGGTTNNSFAGNSIVTSNSTGSMLIATGTQLTVGNLNATTTATSHFGTTCNGVGNIGGQGVEVCGSDNTIGGVLLTVQNINGGTSGFSGLNLLNDKARIDGTNYAGAFLNSSTYIDTTFGTGNAIPYELQLGNSMGIVSIQAASSTSASNAYINFLTGGAALANERMRITSTGLIGVGSTTPGSLFSIGTNGTGINFVDNGTTTFSGKGINLLKGGCFAINSTCVGGSGGGSGTVTSVATGYGVHGGPVTTTGTISSSIYSTYTVSTSSATGDFTDFQSAINALPSTGGLIHATCGTFTLPSGNVGIQPKVSQTIIEGSGQCTQLNFDKANTTNAYEPAVSNLTGLVLRDVYIHQTNATFGGIGINASNTPLFIAERIKIDQTGTSTSIKDTKNLSFYQTWRNLDLRDNTSCVDIGGLPVNDNSFYDIRCAMHSGNGGFAYYIDSSSVNGAQNNVFININSEPTGAATGLTAIYANNAVDNTFIDAYVEGNATGWNFKTNSQRNTFYGGEFITNTTYTNVGSNNQWLGVDKESVAYQIIQASSTIADISANDATAPSLSFIGNTSFAKSSPVVLITLANSSDSGAGIRVVNPGTGAGLSAVSSGTGQAASTTGKVFMNGLTAAVGTPGSICYITTTNQITQNNALTCTVSSRAQKIDEGYIKNGYLEMLMQLKPVQFAYKDQPDRSRWGFYAEDVSAVDHRLGDGYDAYGNPQSLDQNAILAVTVKAVQELNQKIFRGAEENWQDIFIILLILGFMYQQREINRLKK